MTEPLRIAVVGHTNTGKTSVLRTLARDRDFGEVADRPGVTRHVEGVHLLVKGERVLTLFDTPGVEDAIALLAYLERLDTRPLDGLAQRPDGPARIARFLDTPEAKGRFEQEAKVVRQLLASDAGLYVVDARDPVLPKHRDELLILGACARPLLPVLNFVARPDSQAATWRETLARLGLHAIVEFDAAVPAEDGEERLYMRLATLLDARAEAITRTLIDDLARQKKDRFRAAVQRIADLLIDVAALRRRVHGDKAAMEKALADLHDAVRAREQAAVEALLSLYGFVASDYASVDLPLAEGRWETDLFHPQALKDTGVRVARGLVAGAGVGAAIDVMSGGLTLGMVTVAGAAAGGAWEGLERVGRYAFDRARGYRDLTVGDAVLQVLALRQLALARALARRGHAAQTPLRLDADAEQAWRRGKLPEALNDARAHPAWSSLNGKAGASARRQQACDAIAASLLGSDGTEPA
jgi:hypothetical protein